jgi:twinkle protein
MSESKVVKKGSCDRCGSSDANVLYEGGTKFCFSCRTYSKGDDMEQVTKPISINSNHQNFSSGVIDGIPDRAIKRETTQFFNVQVLHDRNHNVVKHIYPYYDINNSHIGNKIRLVENKGFSSEGNIPKAVLFGQNKFPHGGKYLTICEGEIDAMSAYELQGSKWACLSIKNGCQSALKDIKANYDYVNKFDKVVLCFDSDEHGRKAATKVAQIFEPNKCLIMDMRYKDANEYLMKGKKQEFTQDFWNAKPYTPAGIHNLADITSRIYEEDDTETCLYPYDGLNEKLYGMRTGELVTFTAGTGAGKSSLMRELMHHLLTNTEHNIGVFSLEENITRTMLHIMSVEASDRLYIKEVQKNYTVEQLKEFERKTIGTRRFYGFDHFGSITTDEILNRVRYMVKALDCKYILIDHLSILVSGIEGEDERRNIDQLMTKLRSLVEETRCAMLLVSHLRRATGDKGQEQGKEISLSMLRGSHSIAQISDAVIALERDQQAEDPVMANTTTVRVLKNRYAGETGVSAYLLYDKDTGRLKEISNPLESDNQSDVEDFL